MKFNELLDQAATVVPAYRQTVFRTLITALATGGQPGRISSIFRKFVNVLTGRNTVKRFYNFIHSAKIPWDNLWNVVVGLLGDPAIGGRILIALDDTIYGNTGWHIYGRARHFDHAAKTNSSKYIWGHCRVVAGILQFIHGRWACLPFAQRLYMPLLHKVKSSAKLPHSEWLKTKSGIGAELVIGMIERFKHSALIVCDSWFGTLPLLREVRRHVSEKVELLSRMRVSAILYDFPKYIIGRRGRKPKYGNRLASVPELSAQLKSKAGSAKIHLYGKMREVCFSELVCMSGALKCPVKVVFVYYRSFTFPLFTTDLELTAEQMIEYYAARWKIESGFKEIKHEVGALDSQCRNQLSVENHFDLCLFATTFAWMYCSKLDHAPDRLHPTRHSNSFAFADLRRTIASELHTEVNFSGRCPESLIPAVKYLSALLFSRAS